MRGGIASSVLSQEIGCCIDYTEYFSIFFNASCRVLPFVTIVVSVPRDGVVATAWQASLARHATAYRPALFRAQFH